MRDSLRASGLWFFLWSSLGAVALAEPPARPGMLDPGTVLGQPEPGIKFHPVEWTDSRPSEFPDFAGLEAHLTPPGDPDVELVYPCGAWVDPPASWYHYWLEGGWRMSPYAGLMSYGGGHGQTGFAPLAAAGRAVLSPQVLEAASGDLVLELLQADVPHEGNYVRWEIRRRKPAHEVGEGLLMPEGKVIAGLWDRKKRRFVALSRPFEVRGGRTVEAPLRRPAGRADLMVRLARDRDDAASHTADLRAELALEQTGGERPPDVKIEAARNIYAIWYSLPPGPAELRAESKGTYLPPRQLELAPGKIELLEAELKPGPALEVELDVPAALRAERLSVEIRRQTGGEVLAGKAISHRHTFGNLPPARFKVTLKTSFGAFTREADLRSGADGHLLLKPDLIALRGTVFHGDDEHPAKLTFNTVGGTPVVAETDEKGAYEAVLLEPVRNVSIELADVRQEPYVDFFWQAIEASRELDFHLPDVTYAVKVLDTATGKGIAAAAVMVRNAYLPDPEPGEKEQEEEVDGEVGRPDPRQEPAARRQREKVVMQRASTDESGVARLPPLRRGTLDVQASAEGYSPMRQSLKGLAIDGETDRTFEVLLDPVGPTAALRLLLPDGSPAAGAEVMLVDSLATGNSLFSGRADGQGVVRLPRQEAGLVLARHPGAAFLIREWRPTGGDDPANVMAWNLAAASERPLTVRIRDASGKNAAASAELAVWVDGHRLSGRLLAWLTGGSPLADPSGAWQGANLPRGPVAVLAWEPPAREQASAGSLDPQATAVGYPWPDPVEVRALD